MKRSVNFRGSRRKQLSKLGPQALIDTMRFVGMTDEQIKEALLKSKQEAAPSSPPSKAEGE